MQPQLSAEIDSIFLKDTIALARMQFIDQDSQIILTAWADNMCYNVEELLSDDHRIERLIFAGCILTKVGMTKLINLIKRVDCELEFRLCKFDDDAWTIAFMHMKTTYVGIHWGIVSDNAWTVFNTFLLNNRKINGISISGNVISEPKLDQLCTVISILSSVNRLRLCDVPASGYLSKNLYPALLKLASREERVSIHIVDSTKMLKLDD